MKEISVFLCVLASIQPSYEGTSLLVEGDNNDELLIGTFVDYNDGQSCEYTGRFQSRPFVPTTTTTRRTTTRPSIPCVKGTANHQWNDHKINWDCECKPGYAGDPFKDCKLDSDNDGWPDQEASCEAKHCRKDNCPKVPNSGQEDCDKDNIGDSCERSKNPCKPTCKKIGNNKDCELDTDDDGIPDDVDNCKTVYNPENIDSDGDKKGNACDNCPKVANPDQRDSNGNFIGDACEHKDARDTDGDGVSDKNDNCPYTSNPNQLDSDDDGQGDKCDNDDDNDGIKDDRDNCPLCPNTHQLPDRAEGEACIDDYDCDCIDASNCDADPCPFNKKIVNTNFNYFITVNLDPEGDSQVDPIWIITDGGKEILQTKNSDPGVAVGVDAFEGVQYEGTLFVKEYDELFEDNDYIGIVFGYRDSSNFYVVSWKKDTEVWYKLDMLVAEVGVQIKAIASSTGPGIDLKKALFSSKEMSGQSKVIYNYGNLSWQFLHSYRWQLIHKPDIGLINMKLFHQAEKILDSGDITDTTHKGGRLGVYVFSQENVLFSKLSYHCLDND